MRRVALTGGIATGKSWVRRRFAHHGVPTIDADTLAHAALAPGTPGAARILERFGTAVRSADGSIDRKALGGIVFGDEKARRDLEAIVHPAVYEAIDGVVCRAPAGGLCGGRHPAAVRDRARGGIRHGRGHGVRARRAGAAGDWRATASLSRKRGSESRRSFRWRRRCGGPITSSAPTGAMRRRTHRSMRSWRRCQSETSSSCAVAIRSSTNEFHSWQWGHCHRNSVLR